MLIVTSKKSISTEALRDTISAIPGVTGAAIMVNADKTNVPITDNITPLFGSLDLTFDFEGLSLTVPAHNFFQVNTQQAAVLINHLRTQIPSKVGICMDLYCGVGTLGLAIADRCQSVY